MQENPYSSILNTFRRDADSRAVWPWLLGEVVTTSPLVIRAGDQLLSGAELLANPQLLENEEPVSLGAVAGSLSGSCNCTEGNASHWDIASGSLEAQGTFGGVLHSGDRVVLLVREDRQQFVVLCKAVDV